MTKIFTCWDLELLAISLLVCTVATSSGCYRYVRSSTEPPIGSHVELTLNEVAHENLRERGVNFVEYFTTGAGAFDGIILEATDDSLLVQIASVRIAEYRGQTLYQHVALAHADVTQIKQRTINHGATAALVGIGGGILGLMLFEVLGGSGECSSALTTDCQ